MRRCHVRAAALVLAALALFPEAARAQLRAELFAGGFTQPVAFVQMPSDSSVQVVVQQDGRVRALVNGVVQADDYLDLRGIVRNSGEQGLLGLAFAPDYAATGRVFVNFTNTAGDSVIARFTRSAATPLRADPSSRFDLRWPGGLRVIQQPFANHNGGHLAFGPDGYLYIGLGDGGSGNDPFHLAQNPQSLLGKMLRIDVNVPDVDAEGYDVPPTNPFVGAAGVLPEIWSFGLRNPWRWSFDNRRRGGTGALVIADVGQGAWEEIDYEPAGRGGRNYGWRNREGAHDNVTTLPPYSTPLVDPLFEYSHAVGSSITGGYVYRGNGLGSNAYGRYFFADFISSRIWSVRPVVNAGTGEASASDLVEHTSELGVTVRNPSSFGEDALGELYIVSYGGDIYRLRGSGTPGGPGGRRRPASAAPVGFAVPRMSSATAPAQAPAATPSSTVVVSDPGNEAACQRFQRLLSRLDQLASRHPELIFTVVIQGAWPSEAAGGLLDVLRCMPGLFDR